MESFFLELCLILFFSAFIHGGVGFGFPIIATPLIALFTDIQTAIIYTLIPTLFVNIISISSEGNFFKALKEFYPLALFTVIGSAIGTGILIYSSSEIFKLILAFMILIYLFMDKFKFSIPYIRKEPKKARAVFGIGGGIIGGLTNVIAPILIIYSIESKFTKAQMIQAANFCFLFSKLTQIILFSLSSSLTFEIASESFLSVFAVLIALFIGIKLKKVIDEKLYKKVLKGILFSIAMMLFYQILV